MNRCGDTCGWVSVIVAILAGVALGVLYSLGLVAIGIVFWAYLGIGALALLLAPVYVTDGNCGCPCRYLRRLLGSAVATIVAAVVGLIVAPIGGIVAVAVILGVATLFAVLVLGTVVCLANCLCER